TNLVTSHVMKTEYATRPLPNIPYHPSRKIGTNAVVSRAGAVWSSWPNRSTEDASCIDDGGCCKQPDGDHGAFALSNSPCGRLGGYDGWWFWPRSGQPPVSYLGRIRSELA